MDENKEQQRTEQAVETVTYTRRQVRVAYFIGFWLLVATLIVDVSAFTVLMNRGDTLAEGGHTQTVSIPVYDRADCAVWVGSASEDYSTPYYRDDARCVELRAEAVPVGGALSGVTPGASGGDWFYLTN